MAIDGGPALRRLSAWAQKTGMPEPWFPPELRSTLLDPSDGRGGWQECFVGSTANVSLADGDTTYCLARNSGPYLELTAQYNPCEAGEPAPDMSIVYAVSGPGLLLHFDWWICSHGDPRDAAYHEDVAATALEGWSLVAEWAWTNVRAGRLAAIISTTYSETTTTYGNLQSAPASEDDWFAWCAHHEVAWPPHVLPFKLLETVRGR